MRCFFSSTWESWSPREYFHCIQWDVWDCPFKDLLSTHLSLSLQWQEWLCWPRHGTLRLVQSSVPVKAGWWTHWEQLWEEGFGVTDGWQTGHEPAMCAHRSRKPTCDALKEAWPSHLEFKVLNDGCVQHGDLHSSQHLPAFTLLPTQWINLMREGKVQHYNKCFHTPVLKPAQLLI